MLISELEARAKTTGLDALKSSLDGIDQAQRKVSDSTAAMSKASADAERAERTLAEVTQTRTKTTRSAADGWASYTSKLDPLSRALKDVEKGERLLAASQREGLQVTEAQSRAFANAQAQVAKLKGAMDGHSASVGLNRNQQMELLHIGKSVFDQMAAGTPITRALTVEGGRIAQVFGSGTGGVGGAFGVARGLLSTMLTPTVLLTGGITALGAAGALAFSQWNAGQEKLEASLNGLGRASGLTRQMLDQIAQSGAAAAGIHPSDAQGLAAGFNATGRIGPAMNQSLIGISKQFAIGTGSSLADGGDLLAKAFADPAKGADLLNEKLGFLDGTTRALIRSQTAQLDILGAQRTLYAAVEGNISTVVDRTWKLTQAAETAVSIYQKVRDAAGEAVGSAVYQKTPAQQLAEVNAQIAQSQGLGRSPVLGMLGISGSADQLGGLYAQRDTLSKAAYAEERRRVTEAATAKSNALSLEGTDTIRVVMPDIDRFQRLVDQQQALARVAADAGAVARLPGGIDDAGKMATGAQLLQQAIDRTSASLTNFKTGVASIREDSDLAVRAIQAESFAAKLAIDYQKTYNSVLAAGAAPLEALTRAETQRNEALAQATKQAQDAARDLRNQDALVGLKPAQRFAAERDQAIETAKRTYGGGFDSAVSRTLGFEGGLNPADTNGTPSNFGINALNNPGVNVPGLTRAQAVAIYKAKYWDAIDADHIPPELQGMAFDSAVLAGPGMAKKWLSGANGSTSAFMDQRQAFEASLISRDPQKYGPYQSSWASRDASLRGGDTSGIYSTQITSSKDHFDAQMENLKSGIIDKATDGLDKQNQALALQKASVGASAQAIAEMAEKQQLMNQLTDAGLEKDPAMIAWADQMAAGYGRAAKAADELAKSQSKAVEQMDSIRSASKDALSTFVTDMRQGKSAGDALLDVANRLVDKMLDMAENSLIDSLFGKSGTPGGGGGGLLSGIVSSIVAGVHHEGGMVGAASSYRAVSPTAFIGAPRFHGGLGLGHDERPAILQVGEMVVPKQALAEARRIKSSAQAGGDGFGYGGGGMPKVEVHNHNEGGQRVETQVSQGRNGQIMIRNLIVSTMMDDLHGRGKYARALAARTGQGRTGGA